MANYLIKAAVVIGVLVLTVEGYFLYQLNQERTTTGSGSERVAEQYNSEQGSSGTNLDPSDLAYVHTATQDNTSQNSTYLDNPLINDNPDAIIQITQNWNPEGGNGVYNDHTTGIWYDENAGRWAVFNQDQAELPEGAAFNVFVSEVE